MVFDTISQYVRELAEPIKTFGYTIASPSTYLPKAYGSRNPDTGEYFCDSTNLAVEERMYGETVENFNKFVQSEMNRGTSVERLNDFVNQKNFEEINEMAKCLYQEHGVDPDTVAKFSSSAQDVLSHNLEKLYMVAPDLADTADVPFTGEPILDTMIAGSIVGSVALYARAKGKFSDIGKLFYNYKV